MGEVREKPLSPCSSPSAFSSPRNSNENQAEVDTLDLPFKSDALVAEVLDPLTAVPSLIAKDISVVKAKRVVKKKKKRRKNEVIPIVPGLLESSKHQVIPKASCLSSRTNDSMQSEIPVKAVTSCCLLGESSISGCCTEKVKKLAVVSRNEAKEAIETVIQLEGCITGMPVVEDEPKFKDDTDNVEAKNYNDDVVLWSETIEDSNLQLCQQGPMMQMTVSNDVNAQNITKKFSQVQGLATEIVDDSVGKGLMVAQKFCYNYEHPVIFEALTSSNVCPQSSDPFLPLRELPVNNDAAHECCLNVGNTGAANTIEKGKTEMEGIMNFGHCKMEKDGHHQEAISPELVVSGDAEVSAASRTCDDLPDFNSPHGQAERKQQMFSCTSTEHFEVLGVDVSSQSCVRSLQSHSASEISNSILKQDFPDEVNFEENNELDFSGCNLLPQSCCDGAFQDNLVIDASSDRMEHSLALEHRKMEAPCKHCKNANYQPKLSESENFNNCVFCGEEDQKHVGKEETLVLSLVSLGSDTDDQLGKSTRHNQLMSNKTQDLMSQDLKKKVTRTKLVDENFYLKTSPNQGMVPRILPNSKIFTGLVKNTGRTSQIGRHRTWVRTNKPSLILDANLQQTGRNLTKQVPETQGKVQNSSYIRKGNSLIRKQDEPSPMLLPPIDASGITFKSNTERSSVCESRLECMENAASSYSFVERPKTPPLPHSKFTDSSMNANNSFPLPKSVDGRPELISDQCKQHDSQYKDLHSCNLESQEVKGHASIKTNNPKRITYIKRKMNQLIVAPELEIDESSKFSTKTSQIIVPHPEEKSKATPVSSSHVYYRRKRNQLVLNASSSDNQQAGVPIGNSNSVDHSKQNNSVNSRIVFQKEKKAGKSSLVGMLWGFRRSHKIIGTLHRQGFCHLSFRGRD
ncbi:hypothetical protein HPP92_004360 [Vanilla planifolia]|uniref:Uncharacterized protein n=1 Tax=Vanilla planifolia TaxID=51239 RepID=A0A835RRB9_VANPL|nr:hypothetical protein HPP92_004360 [Vanilla planifolia]